jgi:hypothetical protein
MFFLELNCSNKTINVTENSCNIIPEIMSIKLDAHPGIASVKKIFGIKYRETDILHISIPYKES